MHFDGVLGGIRCVWYWDVLDCVKLWMTDEFVGRMGVRRGDEGVYIEFWNASCAATV
jgi:hypothetical protein